MSDFIRVRSYRIGQNPEEAAVSMINKRSIVRAVYDGNDVRIELLDGTKVLAREPWGDIIRQLEEDKNA